MSSFRAGSLHRLAKAFGGDVHAGGRRALLPAPGHGPMDRSVSLLLVDGRLVVHSFGAADWREVLDDLRARGWIDAESRLLEAGGSPAPCLHGPDPTRIERIAAARRLWDEARPIDPRDPAAAHCARRGVDRAWAETDALRAHASAPFSVYRDRGPRAPALLAAIRDAEGDLTAVETTYLDAQGRRSGLARPSRKVVGVMPAGCAVRIARADEEMLVSEGVFTTLSAMTRFGLPGWALLSVTNLQRWTPPAGVRRVVIAADRGAAGERSAAALRAALEGRGVAAAIPLPPEGYGDWNDLDQEEARRKGGSGRPARRGGP